MGQAFLHGNGGPSPLNFKVVGGTSEPSNPKENTIWVNTDVEITGWHFANDDPNLLDFNNWANNVGLQNGSKAVSGNSITLTSNADDCHTLWAGSNAVQIPCIAGRTYILEWEHSGAYGYVYLFPSGGVDNLVMTSAYDGKLELTPADGVTFFTFRIGVEAANTTATYSNIRIMEKERAFEPGTVWFPTGATSFVAFNALKKNSIMIYPISAKQYIGGAWVDKTSKIYRDDAWDDVKLPIVYFVENGKLKVTLKNYSTSGATMTITEDSAGYVTIKGNKEGYHAWHVMADLTGYKTMAVTTAASSAANTACWLCVWPSTETTPKYDNASAKVRLQATGTVTVDVSSLDGEHFVGVTCSTSNKINIADWRLEI